MRLLGKITSSYATVIVIALAAGTMIPEWGKFLTPYSGRFLQIIFFLSALKISGTIFHDIRQDLGLLLRANLYMLIILPLIVYAFSWMLPWDLALAFILLAAMPTGMTAPLLTELAAGKPNLALFLTVTTSLLCPITIPALIKVTANTEVSVDFLHMFFNLVKVIIVPFALAQITARFLPQASRHIEKISKPMSIICLALLLIGVTASQPFSFSPETILTSLGWIGATTLFFGLMHIAGFFLAYHSTRKEHVTMSVCLTYMNITLAIYIAQEFIKNSNVTSILVLAMFPWALLFPIFNHVRLQFLSQRART